MEGSRLISQRLLGLPKMICRVDYLVLPIVSDVEIIQKWAESLIDGSYGPRLLMLQLLIGEVELSILMKVEVVGAEDAVVGAVQSRSSWSVICIV